MLLKLIYFKDMFLRYIKKVFGQISKEKEVYVLVTPNMILIFTFLIFPLIWIIIMSFQKGGLTGELSFVGIKNYINVSKNNLFFRSIINNLIFLFIFQPITHILTISIALLLNSIKKKSIVNLARSLLYLPMLGSMVVASIVWLLMLYPRVGPIPLLFDILTIPNPGWFTDPRIALFTIAIVNNWRGSAFYILTYYAAISNIPDELVEAAYIDGANFFQALFYIKLPFIKPVLGFCVIMGSIWSLQVFDAVFVLTGGGPVNATSTMVWFVYKNVFFANKVGMGATMVIVLLIISLIITLFNLKIFGFGKESG